MGPSWPLRAHSVCFSGTWVSRACASPVWGSVSMRAPGPGPPRKQGLWEGCAGRKGVTPSRVGRQLHPGPGCGGLYCHGDKEAVGGAQEREGASNTAFSSFLRCELHSQISPSLPLHGAHNIRPRHTHCPARPGPQTPHLVPLPAACPAAGHLLWAFTVPSVLWPQDREIDVKARYRPTPKTCSL